MKKSKTACGITARLIILTLLAALLCTISLVSQSVVNSVAAEEDIIYQGFVSNDDCVQRYKEQWWTDVDRSIIVGDVCGDYRGRGTGLRFTGVDIPEDSIIKEAYLVFTAAESTPLLGTRLYIYGENENNPTAIESYQDHVSRQRTSIHVYWTGLPAWIEGEKYASPSIVKIVQEIVDTNNGTGDALTIFVEDPWFDCIDGRYRTFASKENHQYEAAFLRIVYSSTEVTPPPEPPPPPEEPGPEINLRVHDIGYQDGYVKIDLEFIDYPYLSYYVLTTQYPVSANNVQAAITASESQITEQFEKSLETYEKLDALGLLEFSIGGQ